MSDDKKTIDVPIANNVSDNTVYEEKNINYGKYLGVLTIPKIGLKRGFYNINSRYNNIEYNVTLVLGSTMPDQGGNLILMAHSGDAYISYFAYLYRLKIGDLAYITYNGKDYKYRLVNTYDVPKNGKVAINRNYDKTTLTLITCTKDDSTKQSIYILELV
ncbi:MAG: sortase [Bacilli bacterium]|nr:sortase [Bacilli bacterium]